MIWYVVNRRYCIGIEYIYWSVVLMQAHTSYWWYGTYNQICSNTTEIRVWMHTEKSLNLKLKISRTGKSLKESRVLRKCQNSWILEFQFPRIFRSLRRKKICTISQFISCSKDTVKWGNLVVITAPVSQFIQLYMKWVDSSPKNPQKVF